MGCAPHFRVRSSIKDPNLKLVIIVLLYHIHVPGTYMRTRYVRTYWYVVFCGPGSNERAIDRTYFIRSTWYLASHNAKS